MAGKDKFIKAVSSLFGPIAGEELQKVFKQPNKKRNMCPSCLNPVDENAFCCENCGSRFVTKVVRDQNDDEKVVWASGRPELYRVGLMDAESYVCPYCSSHLEYDVYRCKVCGSGFKIMRLPNPKGYGTDIRFWASGRPEIDDTIFIRDYSLGRYIEVSFSDALSENNLSEERFYELFNSISIALPISPYQFLEEILRNSDDVGHSKYLTLEEMLCYIVSRLPGNINSIGELEDSLRDVMDSRYDNCYVDYCINGGWFPPYDYPVSINPFTYQSEQVIIFRMSYDILVDKDIMDKGSADDMGSIKLCCFK